MASLSKFSSLVGGVYDSILRPEGWRSVLEQLCDMTGSVASSIHVLNPLEGRIGLFVEHGTDPEWSARLLAFGKMTPTGSAVFLAEVDEPIKLFDLVGEVEFRESRFYKEWCQPQGYYDMMGALIVKRPREIGAVSIVRHESQSLFGDGERELISLVAPHIRRAVTIAGLLENRAVSIGNLAAVVDQLSAAVMILDRGAAILRANKAARALLEQGDVLEMREGRLAALDPSVAASFTAALANTTKEPKLVPLTLEGGARRIAAVLPVDTAAGIYSLFLHSPEPDIPAIGRHLINAFGLTPREVAVLMPLLEGQSIAEVADVLGVSVATARTHLQHLFTKTKTDRQADLVRVVMQAMPPVRLG